MKVKAPRRIWYRPNYKRCMFSAESCACVIPTSKNDIEYVRKGSEKARVLRELRNRINAVHIPTYSYIMCQLKEMAEK